MACERIGGQSQPVAIVVSCARRVPPESGLRLLESTGRVTLRARLLGFGPQCDNPGEFVVHRRLIDVHQCVAFASCSIPFSAGGIALADCVVVSSSGDITLGERSVETTTWGQPNHAEQWKRDTHERNPYAMDRRLWHRAGAYRPPLGPTDSIRAVSHVELPAEPFEGVFSATFHERALAVWQQGDPHELDERSNWQAARPVGFAARATTLGRRIRFLHRMHGLRPGGGVALDWGAGGGAGLIALAQTARTVFAVDIASRNLAETRRQVEAIADGGRPRLTTLELGPDPLDVADSINEPLDVFVSHATFPHLPSREYGERVLRVAHAAMRPGGVAYVQMRFDDGRPRFAAKPLTEFDVGYMRMTSWPLTDFWDMLSAIGFEVSAVGNVNSSANLAGFYFRKA